MVVTQTNLEVFFIIAPQVFEDNGGRFFEVFKQKIVEYKLRLR